MRRTLVSRKARKRRIAENAEMSGENYYNRQNATAAAAGRADPKPDALNGDAKEAFVTGLPTADGPTFATFRTNTRESDDDRTPLNSRTPPNDFAVPETQSPRGMSYNAARDESGNPLPPSGPYPAGQRGPPPAAVAATAAAVPAAPAAPGYGSRGRGGYPPRGGYGRGGPPGGPRGRGGPIGPMRGGPPGRGRGGYRGPPPVDYGPGPNYGYDAYGAAPAPRPRPTPPADPYGYRGPSPVYRQPSPGIGMALSPSPEPVGQAIEMTPQPRRVPSAGPEPYAADAPPHAVSVDYGEPTSPSSFYSRTQ